MGKLDKAQVHAEQRIGGNRGEARLKAVIRTKEKGQQSYGLPE